MSSAQSACFLFTSRLDIYVAKCFAQQAVNLIVLPQMAYRHQERHLADCIGRLRALCDTLFARPSGAAEDNERAVADHRDIMMLQWRRQVDLLHFAHFEFAWSRSTLGQRRALFESVGDLQRLICIESRDGAYLADLPSDLFQIVEKPVQLFSQCAFSFHPRVAEA